MLRPSVKRAFVISLYSAGLSAESIPFLLNFMKWLKKHFGLELGEYALYMRPDGDRYTKDSDLKKEIYLESIEHRADVLIVFEDRKRNVDMFRELGLICAQVAEGNF